MLKVITVTNSPAHAQPLINSLTKFGWDYVLIETEWKGFGTKLVETYNYLKSHTEVDRFIFCDAHDVVVLGTADEFESKLAANDVIIFNAERGCWPPPVQHFDHMFKKYKHGFNYLNSGVYYASSKLFIKMYENCPPILATDDQWWASMFFLFSSLPIFLDKNCYIFQCYSFIQDDDFTYENWRLKNLKTGTMPLFIHGNGRTDMTKVYELLK